MSALPAGLRIAHADVLADPCALVIELTHGEKRASLLVTKRAGVISVFLNRCPHAGYPLQRADGRVVVQQERYIVCPAHGASFELDTGACAGGPCNGEGLDRVAVTVRDGWIETA